MVVVNNDFVSHIKLTNIMHINTNTFRLYSILISLSSGSICVYVHVCIYEICKYLMIYVYDII